MNRRRAVRLTDAERRSLGDRILWAPDLVTLQQIRDSFEHLPDEDIDVSALRLLIDMRRRQIEEDAQDRAIG